MTSLVIQNIIFIVLVIGFGFVAKRYGRKIKSSFKILAGIIILWIASFLSFFDQFWLQISLLTAGMFISVAGMLSFAKELKRVDFNIDSVEKAVDSILTGVGGKTASIYLINERKTIRSLNSFKDASFALSIPIYKNADIIGYLVLFGERPLGKFNEEKFKTELAFLKLYLENLSLKEKEAKNGITQYLSILVHDLKKPLTAILGFSEILKEEIKNLSEEEALDLITNINKAGLEMLANLNRLNELYELEAGRYKLKFERLNLLDEIRNSLASFSDEIEKKKINIIVDSEHGFEISADRGKIKVMLCSLFSNVLKSLGENSTLRINIQEFEEKIEISIKGITLGSGLDSVLIKSIAELHGGWISLSNGHLKLYLPKFKIEEGEENFALN
jgi:signal transduction histidine kinase